MFVLIIGTTILLIFVSRNFQDTYFLRLLIKFLRFKKNREISCNEAEGSWDSRRDELMSGMMEQKLEHFHNCDDPDMVGHLHDYNSPAWWGISSPSNPQCLNPAYCPWLRGWGFTLTRALWLQKLWSLTMKKKLLSFFCRKCYISMPASNLCVTVN